MKRILFVLCTLLSLTVFCSGTRKKDSAVRLDCIRPEYLKPGDRVALISPSYYADSQTVAKTAEVLRGWGLEPVTGPNIGKKACGIYAGTPGERAADLKWAFRDSSVKAVICNKGGYGSIHLIDSLSLKELGAVPKWLVGFSDITTIHGLLTRAGVMSIHGTMSCFLANGGTDTTSTLVRDLLMGDVPEYTLPPHPMNIGGRASGTLVGGNVCTFAPNIGTIAGSGAGKDLILFIEEVNEKMHNVDRQIRILQMNGVLDRCKGVILGEFTRCGTEFTDTDGNVISAEEMIRNIFEPYGIPVLCGFPAGHDTVNLPLIMGAPVTMDVGPAGAIVHFNIEGRRSEIKTSSILN